MQDEVTEKMSQAWPAIVAAFTAALKDQKPRASELLAFSTDAAADIHRLPVNYPNDAPDQPESVAAPVPDGAVMLLRNCRPVREGQIGDDAGPATLAEDAVVLERREVLEKLVAHALRVTNEAELENELRGLRGSWTLVVREKSDDLASHLAEVASLDPAGAVVAPGLRARALLVSRGATGPRLTRLASTDLLLSWRRRGDREVGLVASQLLRFDAGTARCRMLP